jgi:hypothetical protein
MSDLEATTQATAAVAASEVQTVENIEAKTVKTADPVDVTKDEVEDETKDELAAPEANEKRLNMLKTTAEINKEKSNKAKFDPSSAPETNDPEAIRAQVVLSSEIMLPSR